jgi:undecaprenyl-diphosphatase
MGGMNRAQLVLAACDAAEYRFCRGLNRIAGFAPFRVLLRIASRLGDGPLWVSLLVALPLFYGASALRPALAMAATGIAGHLLYSRLKSALVRERPFMRHAGIQPAVAPLDRYSFPSGHTLHAISFAWQASAFDHALAWLLVPLAALIAVSRVALGLHYPTDVIAGAALGALLASSGLALA